MKNKLFLKILLMSFVYLTTYTIILYTKNYFYEKDQKDLKQFIEKFDNLNYCISKIYYSDRDSNLYDLCSTKGFIDETKLHLNKMIDTDHQEEFDTITNKFTELALYKPIQGEYRNLEPKDLKNRLYQVSAIYGNLYVPYIMDRNFDFFNMEKEDILQRINESSENIIYYLNKHYKYIQKHGFSTEDIPFY